MRAVKPLLRAGLFATFPALVLSGSACSKAVKAEFPRPPASASIEPPEERPEPTAAEEPNEPDAETSTAPPEAAEPVVAEPVRDETHRRRRAPAPSEPVEEPPEPPPPPSPQLARSEAPDPGLVAKLERAERLLVAVEGRALSREREDQLIAARAFLTQAKAALDEGDERRAVVLIDKGLILAEDVERASRP